MHVTTGDAATSVSHYCRRFGREVLFDSITTHHGLFLLTFQLRLIAFGNSPFACGKAIAIIYRFFDACGIWWRGGSFTGDEWYLNLVSPARTRAGGIDQARSNPGQR